MSGILIRAAADGGLTWSMHGRSSGGFVRHSREEVLHLAGKLAAGAEDLDDLRAGFEGRWIAAIILGREPRLRFFDVVANRFEDAGVERRFVFGRAEQVFEAIPHLVESIDIAGRRCGRRARLPFFERHRLCGGGLRAGEPFGSESAWHAGGYCFRGPEETVADVKVGRLGCGVAKALSGLETNRGVSKRDEGVVVHKEAFDGLQWQSRQRIGKGSKSR